VAEPTAQSRDAPTMASVDDFRNVMKAFSSMRWHNGATRVAWAPHAAMLKRIVAGRKSL
jgi:hypothetical protein